LTGEGEGEGEWGVEDQVFKALYSSDGALTKKTVKWGELGVLVNALEFTSPIFQSFYHVPYLDKVP
jgi:hypothetical protein